MCWQHSVLAWQVMGRCERSSWRQHPWPGLLSGSGQDQKDGSQGAQGETCGPCCLGQAALGALTMTVAGVSVMPPREPLPRVTIRHQMSPTLRWVCVGL